MSHEFPPSRRNFLRTALAATGCAVLPGSAFAAPAAEPPKPLPHLGFSLYGTPRELNAKLLPRLKEIGFTAVEIPVFEGQYAAPETLAPAARAEFVRELETAGFKVSALMENLRLTTTDALHRAALERFKRAADWAATWPAGKRPILETVLGGKPGGFDAVRAEMEAKLRDWTKAIAGTGVVLALKAHVSSAVQTPQQVRLLVESAGSEQIRACFDHSHFELQRIPLDESLDVLAPLTVFVHLKDARGEPGKFEFLLPGAGTTDYRLLFAGLARRGCTADCLVEVSAQLFKKPGFDMLAAADAAGKALVPAWREIHRG